MMEAEGLNVMTGMEVGKDITWEGIMEKYDAVCLAIGAMKPRDLAMEGRELDGIHFAMEYLTQQNRVNDGSLCGL
jgi:glutamate synthase (NADPH/NADH) small chain